MRHPDLIASASAVLVALGLTACGDSGQPSFTVGSPPTKPSEFSTVRPSPEMADEAEVLVTSKYGDTYASPECLPADSLDGTGEFNFDCTAEDRRRGERFKLDVVVNGSESGEPVLGPVGEYVCDPVNARGEETGIGCRTSLSRRRLHHACIRNRAASPRSRREIDGPAWLCGAMRDR